MSRPSKEVRVAPNIYQVLYADDGTPRGWRVYGKRDGVLRARRFAPETTLEQLQTFVDSFKAESDRLREERRQRDRAQKGSFAADARRYLALRAVKAMPSYSDRVLQIERWAKAFGTRPRSTLTARDIDEQLQAFFDGGLSGSTVNKLRTALMSLWTKLDGRAAANPVRDAKEFPEADEEPRGQDYALIRRILDAVTDRARPVKGQTRGRRARGGLGALPSPSKAWLELLAWTGMSPAQAWRLTPSHFSLEERWFTTPRRKKGKQPRFPRPVIRKPMTEDAEAAFRRLVALDAFRKRSGTLHNWRSGLRNVWLRALAKVQKELREQHVPHVRLYDIRHSFGTALFKETENLGLVGEMLDHANPRTTRRYALGAIPRVLQDGMAKFERATQRRRGEPASPVTTPVQARRQRPTRAGIDRKRAASSRGKRSVKRRK